MKDMIERVIAEVRPYTMVPDAGLAKTIELTLDAINAGIPGDLVECGTWKGGSSFAMLLAQRYALGEIKRPVWMYDSFQGMGAAGERDGEDARRWEEWVAAEPENPKHFNNCAATLDDVHDVLARLDLDAHAVVFPGWFHETVPHFKPKQIALLRIDCDWYDPCKLVYEELAPLVSAGGPIIVDDYCRWEGCVLATHEYLAQHKLPWRIRSVPNNAGAWMVKDSAPLRPA